MRSRSDQIDGLSLIRIVNNFKLFITEDTEELRKRYRPLVTQSECKVTYARNRWNTGVITKYEEFGKTSRQLSKRKTLYKAYKE